MKCPDCNEEINSLDKIVYGYMESHLNINKDGNPNYGKPFFVSDGSDSEYQCPQCCGVLFMNEIDAVKFLRSG